MVATDYSFLRVSLTAADVEEALRMVTAVGIVIRQVRYTDSFTVSFYLPEKDHGRLRKICERRGYDLRILSRGGLRHWMHRVFARPVRHRLRLRIQGGTE